MQYNINAIVTCDYNKSMNIQHIIHYSCHDARAALVMGTSPRALARARERTLVKALAARLDEACADDDIRVFAAYRRGNRTDFGAERLLYDIQVCRISAGQTADKKKEPFYYIAAALWQIEIDFSRDLRRTLLAVNRLAGGAGENKLIIAAQPASGRQAFIHTLKTPAAACSGEVWLALIPHPADWDSDTRPPDIWQLTAGDWQTAKSSS